MLRALNKREGFTLVELLIVVAIIGILAAIAIPQFAAYRARAYCSQVKSDLANLAIAEEAYYTDNNAYFVTNVPATTGFDWSTGTSPGTIATSTTAFTVSATHTNCVNSAGTQLTYTWDSSAGGLQ